MPGSECCVCPPPFLVRAALDQGVLRFVDGEPLVDSRGMLGTKAGRSLLVDVLTPHLAEIGYDLVIGGVANSGSVLGVLLADRVGAPFVNILVDGPRGSGLRRRLEPDHSLVDRRVVLVDNWIASGASILEAANVVKTAKGYVTGVLAVSACPAFSLTGFSLPVHVGIPLACLT